MNQLEEIPVFLRSSLGSVAALPNLSLRDVYWVGGTRPSLHPYMRGAIFVAVNRPAEANRTRSKPIGLATTSVDAPSTGWIICGDSLHRAEWRSRASSFLEWIGSSAATPEPCRRGGHWQGHCHFACSIVILGFSDRFRKLERITSIGPVGGCFRPHAFRGSSTPSLSLVAARPNREQPPPAASTL